MKDFTYFDVVMATLEREASVLRVARQHSEPRMIDLTMERQVSIVDASLDNYETDEDITKHFRPTDL